MNRAHLSSSRNFWAHGTDSLRWQRQGLCGGATWQSDTEGVRRQDVQGKSAYWWSSQTQACNQRSHNKCWGWGDQESEESLGLSVFIISFGEIFIFQMVLKENVWASEKRKGQERDVLISSFTFQFLSAFFLRYIQSERFFWRSQLFVRRAEGRFGVLIFRLCYQFLRYQVLYVGYERPAGVWFIMFPFRAFTTAIFYNLLLNLVLRDGRRLLGDKGGKLSLPKWRLTATCCLNSVRK